MRLPELAALDANALRDWIARDPGLDRLIGNRMPALPCVVLEEALRGWLEQAHRSRQKHDEVRLSASLKRLEEFYLFTRSLPVLDYSPGALATLKQISAGRGNRDRNDLRIAAICIAHQVPLVTRNVKDFEDLQGLTVETW